MHAQKKGLSKLALEAGFGTRIWGGYEYFTTKYFHPIIALAIILLLYFSLPLDMPRWLVLIAIGGYLIYFILRKLLPKSKEEKFYLQSIQFARAQVAMLSIFMISWVAWHWGEPIGDLWVLYLSALLIISRHSSTQLYLFSVIEAYILMVLARSGGQPSITATLQSLSLIESELFVRAVSLFLISFFFHFLLSNINARDYSLRSYEEIEALPSHDSLNASISERWEKVLKTYLELVNGTRGSVWMCDYRIRQIRPLVKSHYSGDKFYLSTIDDAAEHTLPMASKHLISYVVQSGEPKFGCNKDFDDCDDQLDVICELPVDIYSRMVIPILDQEKKQENVIGVLCIDFDKTSSPRRTFLEDYFEFLTGLARRLKSILKYIKHVEELKILQNIGHRVNHSLLLDTVLDEAIDAIVSRLGFEFATISLVDDQQSVIETVRGNIPPKWLQSAVHPLDSDDIQADVVRSGKQEVLMGWDDRFDAHIWEQNNHHQMIRVFTPISKMDVAGNRKICGTIEAGYYTSTRKNIPNEQLRSLSTFAKQLYTAIENAELYRKTEERLNRLARLHQIGWDVALAKNSLNVLSEVGRALQDILRTDIVMIYRYDQQKDTLEYPQLFGEIKGIKQASLRLPSPDDGVVATILLQKKSYYAPDVYKDPLLSPLANRPTHTTGKRHRTFTERQEIMSFAGVPMIANGEVVGVLCLNYRTRHNFAEDEQQILELSAQFAATALYNDASKVMSEKIIISRERMRLATQLHHSLSQYLPAIKVKVDTVFAYLSNGHDREKVFEDLIRIQKIADRAMNETRVNIFELNAKNLMNFTLSEVLTDYVSEARDFFGLDVQLEISEKVSQLSDTLSKIILMICREGVANAAKHAEATQLLLTLRLNGGDIFVEIEDNGKGFDPKFKQHKSRHGLNMIKEQVEALGGHFLVEGRTPTGVRLEAKIPYEQEGGN